MTQSTKCSSCGRACLDFVQLTGPGERVCIMCVHRQLDFANAKLARAEVLPEKWRDYLDDTYSQYDICADELEAALRGEP